VTAVNASSSAPVYAVNVGGSLVLSSKTTGMNFGFSVSGTTQLVAGAVKAGVDASYSVDGVAKTSASNVVADGIPGIELTLRAPTASSITVNVGTPAPDKQQTIAAVKAFVSAYNDVVDAVRSELKEQRVPNPQSTADARKGDLFGDTLLSGMLDGMRQTVSTLTVGSLTMASIGVSTGVSTGAAATSDMIDGKLTVDESALSAALDSDPAAVQKLLGGMPDTRGFAQAFGDVLDPVQQAGGLLDDRISAAGDQVKLFQSQMDDMEQRLTLREDYLRKQFSDLELALQQSQSQSADLASRLASLPGA
jgi:flagellar hook-associated protein 2